MIIILFQNKIFIFNFFIEKKILTFLAFSTSLFGLDVDLETYDPLIMKNPNDMIPSQPQLEVKSYPYTLVEYGLVPGCGYSVRMSDSKYRNYELDVGVASLVLINFAKASVSYLYPFKNQKNYLRAGLGGMYTLNLMVDAKICFMAPLSYGWVLDSGFIDVGLDLTFVQLRGVIMPLMPIPNFRYGFTF